MELALRNSLTARQGVSTDMQARFIAYLDAKPRTVETYAKALKPFFAYLASNGITQPTREDILAYRDELKGTHKPTTVQAYIVPVRLFFQWAQQEGLYPNVAEHIKGAKISKEHKKDALTSGQIKTILKDIPTGSLQGLRDYAIMALMVTCGLRTIEVVRADIGDLRTAGDSAALYVQGKGQDEKNEYVKLPQPVEKAIRAYLKARGAADQAQPLFASTSNNNQGERMTTRSISGIVKGRFTGAGYISDRLTAHSLRHTAGTLNLLNGGTLEETQQLLRHSNINTTMIYLHHLERAKNNSEARIAAAIF
ncbi:MAG: Tyrosine recombinase XerC [Firmicutes bacterium ADurb.Bin373]|nr:MAG: Tyrosine recombinase XerC [Firmicutes bacterium ADurb.Bin373]